LIRQRVETLRKYMKEAGMGIFFVSNFYFY